MLDLLCFCVALTCFVSLFCFVVSSWFFVLFCFLFVLMLSCWLFVSFCCCIWLCLCVSVCFFLFHLTICAFFVCVRFVLFVAGYFVSVCSIVGVCFVSFRVRLCLSRVCVLFIFDVVELCFCCRLFLFAFLFV